MKPYIAPFGKHKYCEGCAERQPFEERFTPLCPKCAQASAPNQKERPQEG